MNVSRETMAVRCFTWNKALYPPVGIPTSRRQADRPTAVARRPHELSKIARTQRQHMRFDQQDAEALGVACGDTDDHDEFA